MLLTRVFGILVRGCGGGGDGGTGGGGGGGQGGGGGGGGGGDGKSNWVKQEENSFFREEHLLIWAIGQYSGIM